MGYPEMGTQLVNRADRGSAIGRDLCLPPSQISLCWRGAGEHCQEILRAEVQQTPLGWLHLSER
jgi:hypothetical protein